jgi:hypothetical protein
MAPDLTSIRLVCLPVAFLHQRCNAAKSLLANADGLATNRPPLQITNKGGVVWQ